MSTEITEIAFTETDGGIDVRLVNSPSGTPVNIEADSVSFTENGVMAEASGLRYFVPYANISVVKQSI